MPAIRRSPVEAVLTGVVTLLQGSTGVTGTATGGVFNHVPQGTAYPYVMVSSPSEFAQDTYGRFGVSMLVDVKAISQALGDQENARIIDQCIRAVNFQLPSVTAHQILGMTWESSDRFSEIVAGKITRHHVATFRVWAQQSSS